MSIEEKDKIIGIMAQRIRSKEKVFEQNVTEKLMPRYGITPNDRDCWRLLALELVRSYDPKLKGGQPGAPKRWTWEKQRDLMLCADKLQKDALPEKLSDTKVCDRLIKIDRWKENRTSDALRKQLGIARKELTKDFEVIEKHLQKHKAGK